MLVIGDLKTCTAFPDAAWCRPPQVFIDAVLACPPMRSAGYWQALLANGGRSLLTRRVI